LESGTLEVIKGDPDLIVTRSSNASVVNKVLLIYTADETPDSDLAGNMLVSQGANALRVSPAFTKSGTYSYVIIEPWWESNPWYHVFPIDQIADIEQPTWTLPPIQIPAGTWYATIATRGTHGVGPRVTAGPFTIAEAAALPTDTAVPDAPFIAALKKGALSELIGAEKPSGTPAGWNNVSSIELQVATDAAFSNVVLSTKVSGLVLTYAHYIFAAQSAGHFYARARGVNAQGNGSYCTAIEFDCDQSTGDTDVPSAPVLTLKNTADEATVDEFSVRARVDFRSCTNRSGLFMAWVQLHTSATFTEPEASPVYSPGTRKATIVNGGFTLTDAGASFLSLGLTNEHIIMLSYDTPWPGSPATRVFLALVKTVDSNTQITFDGPWTQPTGSYTYRICNAYWVLDSGAGFCRSMTIYDQAVAEKGYVELDIPVPVGTNYYGRAWIFNLLGRSATSSVTSAKQSSTVPVARLHTTAQAGIARSNLGLDSSGDLARDIKTSVKISGRSEAISTTVQKLNASGLLLTADDIAADGSTYARVTSNEKTGGGRAYAGLDGDGYVALAVPVNRLPSVLQAPAGSGLFTSSSALGFYSGGAWKTYIDVNGNFLLGDIAGGDNGIAWNQSTGALTIKGNVRIDGNCTFGSGYNPSAKIASGGAAADVNSGATTISGAKITTGSITADRLNVSSLSAVSAIIGSVKTAVSPNERLEFSGNDINQFNSANTLVGYWSYTDDRTGSSFSVTQLYATYLLTTPRIRLDITNRYDLTTSSGTLTWRGTEVSLSGHTHSTYAVEATYFNSGVLKVGVSTASGNIVTTNGEVNGYKFGITGSQYVIDHNGCFIGSGGVDTTGDVKLDGSLYIGTTQLTKSDLDSLLALIGHDHGGETGETDSHTHTIGSP
jgi:hypothetical protein